MSDSVGTFSDKIQDGVEWYMRWILGRCVLMNHVFRQGVQPCAQYCQQDPNGIAEATLRDAIKAIWTVQAGHGYALPIIPSSGKCEV
jgi:hypothetical protein